MKCSVSPEENELINKAVALSGLPKQEYCYRRCLNQDVVVQGNPRVFKALHKELAAVLTELQRIEAGNGVDDDISPTIFVISVFSRHFQNPLSLNHPIYLPFPSVWTETGVRTDK